MARKAMETGIFGRVRGLDIDLISITGEESVDMAIDNSLGQFVGDE